MPVTDVKRYRLVSTANQFISALQAISDRLILGGSGDQNFYEDLYGLFSYNNHLIQEASRVVEGFAEELTPLDPRWQPDDQ